MTRALWLTTVSSYITIDDELISILIPDRYKGLVKVAELAILKLHIHRLGLPVVKLSHDHDIHWILRGVVNLQYRDVVILVSIRCN